MLSNTEGKNPQISQADSSDGGHDQALIQSAMELHRKTVTEFCRNVTADLRRQRQLTNERPLGRMNQQRITTVDNHAIRESIARGGRTTSTTCSN